MELIKRFFGKCCTDPEDLAKLRVAAFSGLKDLEKMLAGSSGVDRRFHSRRREIKGRRKTDSETS